MDQAEEELTLQDSSPQQLQKMQADGSQLLAGVVAVAGSERPSRRRLTQKKGQHTFHTVATVLTILCLWISSEQQLMHLISAFIHAC